MAGRLAGPAHPPSHGATLTIDLRALAANWRLLRDRAVPAECAAVVKADAYGIGLEQAALALRMAGCRTFFVAHLGEAERLRAADPGAVVYVLNGLPSEAAPGFVEVGARPVLGSMPEVEEWTEAHRTTGRVLPVALHVDTGMNRLGLGVDEALQLARARPADLSPSLLMSHLVSAEEPGSPVTARQIAAFERVMAAFPSVAASLANCSGLFLPEPPIYDLARPGYALYGGNPTPGRPNPMRPVVRLEASILQTRNAEEGDTVGYNGRWTSPGRRRLATLSIGYADGYPRAAGGTDRALAEGVSTGEALVGGVLCPFVGRVSMDLSVIDVTDAPPEEARRGKTAILIGDELDIDEVGRRAGTIGYEILTGLGHRYARRYIGD